MAVPVFLEIPLPCSLTSSNDVILIFGGADVILAVRSQEKYIKMRFRATADASSSALDALRSCHSVHV